MKRRYASLKEFLRVTGETQESLAARLGVSQASISCAANGHPIGFGLAKRLAQVTGVPIESFGSRDTAA